jgi:hypothetical protein
MISQFCDIRTRQIKFETQRLKGTDVVKGMMCIALGVAGLTNALGKQLTWVYVTDPEGNVLELPSRPK